MYKYFFIRTDGRYIKINLTDMVLVESCRNYCRIVTEKKSYMVLVTMKRMEELLPPDLFVRIHRSFIISLEKVLEFNTDTVYLQNKELPIGHLYKGVLEKVVTIANDSFCKLVRIGMYENNIETSVKVI